MLKRSYIFDLLLSGGLLSCLLLFLTEGVTLTQQPDLKQKITVRYSDIPLESILKDLSQSAHIQFSYSSDRIPVNTKITLFAENETLEKVP